MEQKDTAEPKARRRESLLWLIIVTIAISALLVAISFGIFLRSGAFDTIQQITTASKTLAEDDLKGYDVTSPIQASDLLKYGESLDSRIRPLEGSEDFGPSQLDDSVLGI